MDVNQVTKRISGCAYKVSNGLGSGFLEKVYENALAYELRKDGLRVFQQHPMQVHYDGEIVGEYYADLLVEGCVLVESKTVKVLDEVHMAQCLNYLKATGLHLCLLINFYRPRVEIKRIVHQLEETVDETCDFIIMLCTKVLTAINSTRAAVNARTCYGNIYR